MTKRRDVLKAIRTEAKAQDKRFKVRRHGSNHDQWDLNGQCVTIPRHTEIDNELAKIIFSQCEKALGKDWWRR